MKSTDTDANTATPEEEEAFREIEQRQRAGVAGSADRDPGDEQPS